MVHTSHKDLCHLYMTFMAFIDKNQNNQCVILLWTWYFTPAFWIQHVKQQEKTHTKKKKKPVVTLVKSHSLIIHSHFSLSKETQMQSYSSYYLGFFIDYRNIAMTFIKEKQKKKKEKSQSVNSCIKPVHFCIYRVRDHLCTCYILSHSG